VSTFSIPAIGGEIETQAVFRLSRILATTKEIAHSTRSLRASVIA
jgi:hypothetical protein